MGCGAASVELRRCRCVCVGGFARLGETGGTGICNGRAIHLVSFRLPGLCVFLRAESDMGSVHPRPTTVAHRHLVARAYSDLAGCVGN